MSDNYLKITKGNPEWIFTPDYYFNKKYRVINGSSLKLTDGKTDNIILRQSPTDRDIVVRYMSMEIDEWSVLNGYIVNDSSPYVQHIFMYDIVVKDFAEFNCGWFVNGGKLNKHIIKVKLGEGSIFNIFGSITNNSGGDSEIITVVDHDGDYSSNNQYFICEASNNSQTVYQNMSWIPKKFQKCQSLIEVSNLATDNTGICHSSIQSRNYSPSSKSSYISTTETIDENRIYYLQSRGIDVNKAKNMILSSHRKKILDTLRTPGMKTELEFNIFS